MSKSKLSPLTIGVAIIGMPLIIFFAKDVFRKPQSSMVLPTATPLVSNQKTVVVTTPISKPLSQTRTFPHELLPGFNITIPSSWVISGVKQFGEKDKIGFTSTYFENLPNEHSMAVRIFKNGTFFDLIFDLIYDGSNYCSDELTYIDIGNNWYQIKNKDSYFYSKNVVFNGMKAGGEDSHKYKVCILSGAHLTNKPPKQVAPDGNGALIIEDIKVYGPTSQDILNEINAIIRSIVL